jgi:K+/H+ antiporter YhaU regulatory subunit KhtT
LHALSAASPGRTFDVAATRWVECTGDASLGARLHLSPIALRHGTSVIVNPHRDERLNATDELVLIGRDDRLDKLGE